MFKSQNFAVINCMECGETIRIEPQVPFDSDFHTCVKKPLVTNKPTVAKSKEDSKKKKSFMDKVTGK